MADTQLPRPVHSEMTHGLKDSALRTANATSVHKRKPEDEIADSGESTQAASGSDAAAVDSTVVEAGGASSGIGSLGLTALGGLGLLGVVAAAAGDGGGKESTPTPPVQHLPDPVIPQQPKPDVPKSEEPKPVEPKPAESKPAEPTPEQSKPIEPKPEEPKPVEPTPEQPKPAEPVEPMPEQPKSEPKSDVTPPDPKPETPSTSEPVTPESPKPVDPAEPVLPQQLEPTPNVTPPAVAPPEATPPVVTPPAEPSAPSTPNPVEPAPEQPKPDAPPPDVTAPVKPELALKNDTGEAGDKVTSDSAVTVSGLEDGATWRFSEDDGKTWHQGDGMSFSASRRDGVHQVQVVQMDKSGNVSEAASFSFTLDTGAPTLQLKNDTGLSSTDKITNDGTLTVSGLRGGSTWSYSLDGGGHWIDGAGSEIATSALGEDGLKMVQVKQTDSSGTSGYSQFSFTLDTTAPAPLTLVLKKDDGPQSADWVTSDGTLLVQGLEPGAVVGDLGHIEEFDASVVGHNEILKYQMDLAGNWSRPFIAVFLRTSADAAESKPILKASAAECLHGTSGADRYVIDKTGYPIILDFSPSQGDVLDLSSFPLSGDGPVTAASFTRVEDEYATRIVPNFGERTLINLVNLHTTDKIEVHLANGVVFHI